MRLSSVGVIALIVILVPACKKSSEKTIEPAALHIKKNTPDSFAKITIKNFTLKELEKSKELEVVVNAQECNFLNTSDTIECVHVTCTLLDHKKVSATLKTDTALVNRTDKNIFLSGKVAGKLKDLSIYGSNIHYNFLLQTLSTNKTMLCTHPDFTLSGGQSFVDLKNNRIEMSNGVESEFKIDMVTKHDKQQRP